MLTQLGARYVVVHAGAPSYAVLLPYACAAYASADATQPRSVRASCGRITQVGTIATAAKAASGEVAVAGVRLRIQPVGPDIVLTLPHRGT